MKILSKKDGFRTPISLDIKFALMTARQMVRYHASPTELFRGPDSLNNLLAHLYSKNPVCLTHTLDFDIYLDPSDMGIAPSIAVLGWHELKTTELFFNLLRKGSTVIDVGANVGYFTLLAAKLVGDQGRVLAFEPEPNCFSLLSRSVQKNGFRNVQSFRECVSNTDGELMLHLSANHNKGLHSILRDVGGGAIPVPSVRLDAVADNLRLNSIDLLKIDAEGAEPEVLQGANHLISGGKVKNIVMEWEHPEVWVGRDSLMNMLHERFDVYRFSRSIPFVSAERLEHASTDSFRKGFGANLYLRLRNALPERVRN